MIYRYVTRAANGDDTDFVSTCHNIIEDVINVLHTEQPHHYLVCNTEETQRVHVSRGQDWQKNNTLGAL